MHQIRQNARPTIRERREKREPKSERERDDRASPRRRAAQSSIERCDPARRTRTARRSMSGAIVRRATSALVDRDRRSSIAPLDRRSRSCTAPLVGAVRSSDERRDRRSRRSLARRGTIVPLSLIWALSSLSLSLSLSLFGSELKWKWGEKFISGLKVKFVVNQKSFSGK